MRRIKRSSRDRVNSCALQFSILMLLGYSIAGCSSPISPPPKVNAPGEVHSAPVQTARAIIYFQRPTADSGPLFAAVSDACRCTPAFFRTFRDDALIYVITLPQGQNFAAFEKALMRSAPQLGIVSIEQDVLEHF
jgi:hypothetical protein